MIDQYRDIKIGSVDISYLDRTIKIAGWVFRKRDHGSLIFVDLRDFSGSLQLVFDSAVQGDAFKKMDQVTPESVILVEGALKKRSDESINPDAVNGNLELHVTDIVVESLASVLPLQVNSDDDSSEELRLKYRYLDLRREKIKKNIVLRSKVISDIRAFMQKKGFLEFQTPILTASSPEGARDYLVPSRVHNGKFYALPQAPQQFKQMLMVAGFDKYFQIAPCFRDEDSRADRSPGEFYQLDIEMSFVTQNDIFALTEDLLLTIFKKYSDKKIDPHFVKIKYQDSMLKYGTDKPDLRNPIIISDVTSVFAQSDFALFSKAIQNGSVVRAIPAFGAGQNARSFFDLNIKYATENLFAKGLGYIAFTKDMVAKGPIAKFLSQDQIKSIVQQCGVNAGDAVFFSCDAKTNAEKIACGMRNKLGQDLGLIDQNTFKFCWVVDFPYFEVNEQTGKLDFCHNPFSMPVGGIDAFDQDPLQIVSMQYDIVCNGIELSSGAIRNHKPEIMYKAFSILGYTKDYVDQSFGPLLQAFKYGAPPHGGLAPGIDRMIMLLCNQENIREVIAFPMSQKCQDLMMGAPSLVDERHLKELGLSVFDQDKI